MLINTPKEGDPMTTLQEPQVALGEVHEEQKAPGGFYKWLTSVDHKVIGKNYMYTALVFMFIAGAMALLIRTQLFNPNGHFVLKRKKVIIKKKEKKKQKEKRIKKRRNI
jgi:hypothetical protein